MAASGSNWGTKAASALAVGGAAAPFFMRQPDYKNPASSAMPYLDQVPGETSKYYQPYIDRGNAASDVLQGEYGTQINDPGAINARLGQGYQQSPGYQFKLQQALMAGDNAAASGGMAGSNQHQQQNMQLANDISSQDFNDYMSRVLGIYQGGIKGNEGFAERGYNASGDMATNVGNSLLNKAKLQYMGTNQENEANQAQLKSDSGMWGDLAGFAGNALKAFAL